MSCSRPTTPFWSGWNLSAADAARASVVNTGALVRCSLSTYAMRVRLVRQHLSTIMVAASALFASAALIVALLAPSKDRRLPQRPSDELC
jgi:hypothetical protein